MIDHPLFFDRDGKPIEAEEYERIKMNDPGYARVALTHLYPPTGGMVSVSTVWIGTDLGLGFYMGRDDAPTIYETMTFGGERQYTERAKTVEEARTNHSAVLAVVTAEHPDAHVTDVIERYIRDADGHITQVTYIDEDPRPEIAPTPTKETDR